MAEGIAIDLSGADDLNRYSPDEEERLARNLKNLTERIHNCEFREWPVNESLIRHFHSQRFHQVRQHAGRTRSKDWGAEHLVFGPNRSPHRATVANDLEQIFQRVQQSLQSLANHQDSPDYEKSALYLAAWAHARIIQVHPFTDGNGRSSRALLTHILVMTGLRPIPIEANKAEYNSCLNHFFRTKNLQPLVDLLLEIATREFNP